SVHHLFTVDQCHPSMQTLRWQDRPLPCPRGQSDEVDPWGTSHAPRVQALLVPWLHVHRQRSHQHLARPQQTIAAFWESRHCYMVPLVFLPAHREGGGCPEPHQLAVGLVAAQCCCLLRDSSSRRGNGRSLRDGSCRRQARSSYRQRKKALGT